MAGFIRRTIYDLNLCQFQGRVTDQPILEIHKRTDGKEIEVIRFQVVTNSNPFSPRQATYFRCFAYGIKATRIMARIKKGYTVVVFAEAKSLTIKADKKLGTPSYQLNEFEVKWLFIDSIPIEGDTPLAKEARPNTKSMFTVRDIRSLAVSITDEQLALADAEYTEVQPI